MIYLLLLALPHLIWQTDKTKDLSPRALETRQTWIDLNPGYRYSLYDDADIETYIQQKWPPEYLAFFHALPLGVMKADLWRYLVLTTEGGIYSDIDSVCLIPIRDWQVRDRPHVLLIDTDSDTGQFCQWTFAATPHHPALEFLCNYALKRWQKRGITHCADGSIDVLGATGPTL
ncbi:MAG TPA: glycosyltransferase, partial [Chlamydiales bacterium]|nr:glycosyltransferase [Chlamydiales bacterium]